MSANLFSRLFDGLADPAKLAIETADGGRISYGDLVARAGRVANVLIDRGVAPGDRVAAQTEKSVEALVLYLATVRAGGVYLPLNTAYTLHELDYFIGDAEPKLVVCDPSKRDGIAEIAAKVGARVETLGADGQGSLTDAAAQAGEQFATVPRGPDDLAAILYTSGTTGRSKGAMLSHDNLASNSLTLVEFWRFTPDDVLIHALPIYHTHGLFVASNVTLFARAAMIFLPKLDPDKIIDLMARATVLMGVPTFYTRLLQSPRLTKESTSHMRLFISGSAPLLADTHREWQARTGHAVLERYGMTETNMNTSNPYDGERVPGAVGPALPGVQARVTDPETGKELPRGEIRSRPPRPAGSSRSLRASRTGRQPRRKRASPRPMPASVRCPRPEPPWAPWWGRAYRSVPEWAWARDRGRRWAPARRCHRRLRRPAPSRLRTARSA